MSEKRKLTEAEERFARVYSIERNVAYAGERAGYSGSMATVMGVMMMSNPAIKARIAQEEEDRRRG